MIKGFESCGRTVESSIKAWHEKERSVYIGKLKLDKGRGRSLNHGLNALAWIDRAFFEFEQSK